MISIILRQISKVILQPFKNRIELSSKVKIQKETYN